MKMQSEVWNLSNSAYLRKQIKSKIKIPDIMRSCLMADFEVSELNHFLYIFMKNYYDLNPDLILDIIIISVIPEYWYK